MREEHDPIDQVRKRLIDGSVADEATLKDDRQGGEGQS